MPFVNLFLTYTLSWMVFFFKKVAFLFSTYDFYYPDFCAGFLV